MFVCETCKKYFGSGSTLIRHVSEVHQKKSYPCLSCSRVYTRATTLGAHLRSGLCSQFGLPQNESTPIREQVDPDHHPEEKLDQFHETPEENYQEMPRSQYGSGVQSRLENVTNPVWKKSRYNDESTSNSHSEDSADDGSPDCVYGSSGVEEHEEEDSEISVGSSVENTDDDGSDVDVRMEWTARWRSPANIFEIGWSPWRDEKSLVMRHETWLLELLGELNHSLRLRALRNATSSQIDAFSEIAHNVDDGRVPLTSAVVSKLELFGGVITKLADATIHWTEKRRLLTALANEKLTHLLLQNAMPYYCETE